MKVEKLDSVSIGVKNLDEAEKLFSDLFGMTFKRVPYGEVEHKREMADSAGDAHRSFVGTSRRAAISPMGLRLVEMNPPVEKEGVRVFYLKVTDIEQAVAEMKRKGIRLLHETKVGNVKQAQFNPDDLHGCRIDLIEYEGPSAIDAVLRK
ncbi:MAG: VOC family protein [Chloroflexota bacterium]